MSDHIVPMHTLKCDSCGKLAGDDEIVAMSDYGQAVDRWCDEDYGWIHLKTEDGIGDYCFECYEIDDHGDVHLKEADGGDSDEGSILRNDHGTIESGSQNDGKRDFGGYDWQDHPWQW